MVEEREQPRQGRGGRDCSREAHWPRLQPNKRQRAAERKGKPQGCSRPKGQQPPHAPPPSPGYTPSLPCTSPTPKRDNPRSRQARRSLEIIPAYHCRPPAPAGALPCTRQGSGLDPPPSRARVPGGARGRPLVPDAQERCARRARLFAKCANCWTAAQRALRLRNKMERRGRAPWALSAWSGHTSARHRTASLRPV